MPRAEEECQAYMKPGVNSEEEMEKYVSGCGCGHENLFQCTDLDIEIFDSCKATEDCKKGIQSIYDMLNLNIPIPITDPTCLVAFEAIKWMNDICVNQ